MGDSRLIMGHETFNGNEITRKDKLVPSVFVAISKHSDEATEQRHVKSPGFRVFLRRYRCCIERVIKGYKEPRKVMIS